MSKNTHTIVKFQSRQECHRRTLNTSKLSQKPTERTYHNVRAQSAVYTCAQNVPRGSRPDAQCAHAAQHNKRKREQTVHSLSRNAMQVTSHVDLQGHAMHLRQKKQAGPTIPDTWHLPRWLTSCEQHAREQHFSHEIGKRLSY